MKKILSYAANIENLFDIPVEFKFFDGTFDAALSKEKAGSLQELLEMVRLAPSAVNKQPWRVVSKEYNLNIEFMQTNPNLSSDMEYIASYKIL